MRCKHRPESIGGRVTSGGVNPRLTIALLLPSQSLLVTLFSSSRTIYFPSLIQCLSSQLLLSSEVCWLCSGYCLLWLIIILSKLRFIVNMLLIIISVWVSILLEEKLLGIMVTYIVGTHIPTELSSSCYQEDVYLVYMARFL